MSVYKFSSGGKADITLEPAMSGLFLISNSECSSEMTFQKDISKEKIVLDARNWMISDDTENIYTLDSVSISFNNKEFTEYQNTIITFNELLMKRYYGNLWVRYCFDSNFIPKNLLLVIEPNGIDEVRINNHPLSVTSLYRLNNNFFVYDISEQIRLGKNEIVIKQDFHQSVKIYDTLFNTSTTESLLNCLTFDSELENVYLIGSFRVKSNMNYVSEKNNSLVNYGRFYIDELQEKIDSNSIVKSGFPFFSGRLSLSQEFEWHNEGKAILKLRRTCQVIEVYINDTYIDDIMFDNYLDISDALKFGRNTLKLTLVTSGRNTFGPFHHPDFEPFCVGPEDFGENNFENTSDMINQDYYSFADFSVSNVEILIK